MRFDSVQDHYLRQILESGCPLPLLIRQRVEFTFRTPV
jgi:hypothetical protein